MILFFKKWYIPNGEINSNKYTNIIILKIDLIKVVYLTK